jgi:hypothetical protein
MDKICAIMDAQGFVQDGLFYPREISIISHTVKMTILVEPELNYSEMNVKDRVTNTYISNNILGMSMRGHKEKLSHNLSPDALEQIGNLYDMVRKEDEKYLGISNDQLAHILKIIDIPFIDLKGYNCPSYKALAQRYRGIPCNFHERQVPDRRRLRCAEKKCELLWKWRVSYLTL